MAQLPPHDLALERAVLGAAMLEGAVLTEISDLLVPETFYDEFHGKVWTAILALYRAGRPVDILTVTRHLITSGVEAKVAGIGVSELTQGVASSANIEYHSRLLMQFHINRHLIQVCDNVRARAYRSEDCFDLLDKVSNSLSELNGYLVPRQAGTAADEAEALAAGVRPKFIEFHHAGLRKRKVMCQAGLVHTVAGRTGMGKSIFSTEEAWAWCAGRNDYVLMFSPEMTKRQITSRILSRESGVPYSTILAGSMNEQEQDAVSATHVRIGDQLERLIVDDTSGVNPLQMDARVERAMGKYNIIAVVLDHLHEMTSGIAKLDTADSSRPKVAYCIGAVNQLAKDIATIPFLVMAQLNRDVEKRGDRKPQVSDILWSGDVEQKSAMIGLLYRPGYYEKEPPYEDEMQVAVAKYRDGAVGVCHDKVIPALSRIGDDYTPLPAITAHPPRNFQEPGSTQAPF